MIFINFLIKRENNFTNIRLIDGDVINVPVVKEKISISGEVNRPMTYELKDEESLEDLISYAAGLTPLSSNNIFVKLLFQFQKDLQMIMLFLLIM